MGLAKDVLERQLELATADLKKYSDRLTEAGLDQKAQKKGSDVAFAERDTSSDPHASAACC